MMATLFGKWLLLALLLGNATKVEATPSMWWIVARSPLGWVESFRVDSPRQTVRVTINLALWERADYLERFALLRQLGLEAQRSGYGVILLNPRQQILAEYRLTNGTWQYSPANLGAFPFRRDTGTGR